jgi:hypothetical protein
MLPQGLTAYDLIRNLRRAWQPLPYPLPAEKGMDDDGAFHPQTGN